MLRSRIIPFLLLTGTGLIKTKQFKRYKYIGDVINAIRIFNEKSVDELALYGIDCTLKNEPPNFEDTLYERQGDPRHFGISLNYEF